MHFLMAEPDTQMRERMARVRELLSPKQRDGVLGAGPMAGELVTAVRAMADVLDALIERAADG